jgi:hypothetical protein
MAPPPVSPCEVVLATGMVITGINFYRDIPSFKNRSMLPLA